MQSLITCMGEILIDFLPIEANGQTTGFSMHPGGAPFNVAVGLARLGQQVAFASKISSDLFGRYLQGYVRSEGIDTRFLLNDEAQSTLAFVSHEGGEPSYAFYSEGTADTLLRAEELPTALFDETAVLHCGSISLLRGSTPEAVLAAVERLKGRALISFDPNLRPGLVRDEQGYRELLKGFFALADIVKISAADLAWLAPGVAIERAAADLAAFGAALVVVTRGGDGVLALAGQGATVSVPPFRVQVVDTVGAGDAFSAGLLAGLAERGVASRPVLEKLNAAELEATLGFASAVAALTCSRAGADPPRRDAVEQFMAEYGH